MLAVLRNPAYRRWLIGSSISTIGLWIQRVGQDWLVLTELTDRDASALGFATALQFAPQLLLAPGRDGQQTISIDASYF